MKLIISIILIFLLLVFIPQSYAACSSTCNNDGSVISLTSDPNVFSGASAQAYWWETCDSNISISGSNTNQSVSVSGLSQGESAKLKLTRFIGGQCYESCRTLVGPDPYYQCPTGDDIFIQNEGGGGLCTTGQASLSGYSNISSIHWTWALGGHSGDAGTTSGTTVPIYYPSGDWTNYYLVVYAQVTFDNGQVCPTVSNNLLLDCGEGPGLPVKGGIE